MLSNSDHMAGGQNGIPVRPPPQNLIPPQIPGYFHGGQDNICSPNAQSQCGGLIVKPENLPPQLRNYIVFCYWRYAHLPGRDKPAKIPYSPITGQPLDVNDYLAFDVLENVLNYQERGFDGIGVGVGAGICAIDIDHCRSPDGTWSDMARDVCMTMRSYTEISPSGRGLRILFFASGFKFDKLRYFINRQELGLEVYISGATAKYVSVTGHALFPGEDLDERGPQLQMILDRYMIRPTPASSPMATSFPSTSCVLDDEDVIEAATRGKYGEIFVNLMCGDTSDYDYDASRADMALCGQLAFYTAKNAGQMDRIFRKSGLMRPKWDQKRGCCTYGELTIRKALDTQRTVYSRAFAALPSQALPTLQSVGSSPGVQYTFIDPLS